MEKIIIAAVSKNYIIGKNGLVPWHSKEELGHFKSTTAGFPVIMGRKTWESIGTSLKNRLNIVISNNPSINLNGEGTLLFNSLEKAFQTCKEMNYQKVFIIGGGEIFNESISYADSIILSIMKFEAEGDTFFPKIDSNIWRLNFTKEFTDFVVHHYIRKGN